MTRYALYYTPAADSLLALAAAEWLGRDAASGRVIDRPSLVSGVADRAFDISLKNACRYGFHGTLKAPFALANGYDRAQLEEALADYCAQSEAFLLPNFEIGQLGPFFALLPASPCPELSALAADLVRQFDRFRAPLSDQDLARRKPDKLSDVQRQNLLDWGYPYIFESFRFHMTLTDPIDAVQAPAYREALERHFAPYLTEPYTVSTVSLFVEEGSGAPFRLFRTYPLKSSPADRNQQKDHRKLQPCRVK